MKRFHILKPFPSGRSKLWQHEHYLRFVLYILCNYSEERKQPPTQPAAQKEQRVFFRNDANSRQAPLPEVRVLFRVAFTPPQRSALRTQTFRPTALTPPSSTTCGTADGAAIPRSPQQQQLTARSVSRRRKRGRKCGEGFTGGTTGTAAAPSPALPPQPHTGPSGRGRGAKSSNPAGHDDPHGKAGPRPHLQRDASGPPTRAAPPAQPDTPRPGAQAQSPRAPPSRPGPAAALARRGSGPGRAMSGPQHGGLPGRAGGPGPCPCPCVLPSPGRAAGRSGSSAGGGRCWRRRWRRSWRCWRGPFPAAPPAWGQRSGERRRAAPAAGVCRGLRYPGSRSVRGSAAASRDYLECAAQGGWGVTDPGGV